MDARNESTYGRNLIIRLALLAAISVLTYASPGAVAGQDGCGMDITETPAGDVVCVNCPHEDSEGDACESGYCCFEDANGDAWGIDENGELQRYTCPLQWDTCEEN